MSSWPLATWWQAAATTHLVPSYEVEAVTNLPTTHPPTHLPLSARTMFGLQEWLAKASEGRTAWPIEEAVYPVLRQNRHSKSVKISTSALFAQKNSTKNA